MPTSLYSDLQAALIAMALVMPRVYVCLTILPGFGMTALPGMARRAAALAIALPATVPTFLSVREAPPGLALGFMLSIKEAALGLMLGALLAIPFWVVQSIGSVFDNQRMAVPTPVGSSAVDQEAGAVGGMLVQAVALVMVQAGLFAALARILIESFGPWPAHELMPPFDPGHLDVVVQRFGELFWHIIVYGAPIIIPLLLIEFGFAMLGVFAPSMQVTFASSPLKSLVGLFVILLYWPTLSHYVAGDFSGLLQLIPSMLDASSK
jgi:type III secretion protein T